MLGTERLASARIVATRPLPGEPIEDSLVLVGVGRGHGVGLCQTGARELAAEGWTATRILSNYYPRAELADLAPAAPGGVRP